MFSIKSPVWPSGNAGLTFYPSCRKEREKIYKSKKIEDKVEGA